MLVTPFFLIFSRDMAQKHKQLLHRLEVGQLFAGGVFQGSLPIPLEGIIILPDAY